MHIPDAVLDPTVAVATSLVAAGGIGYGVRSLRESARDRTTVLMGSMAAFVFAAQMVNFPVPFVPASGHLLGGVLAAVLLGPWAGALVVGAVLVVQCFLFGDGGLTALGANFVNMGLVGSLGGYAIYAPIRRGIGGPKGVLIGAMVAAWFSVILASGAFAVELTLSNRGIGFFSVLGWMALVHSAIGLGEALITGSVVRFLLLVRPDLVDGGVWEPGFAHEPPRIAASQSWVGVAVGGLAISTAVAIFLAPLASAHPDGLEYVGTMKATFLVRPEPTPTLTAPIAGYAWPGLGTYHPAMATAVAGLVGTLVVFGVALGLARGFARGDEAGLAAILPHSGGSGDAV